MIIDTSAVLAILLVEDERPSFLAAIADAEAPVMPAPVYVETTLKRVFRLDPHLRTRLDSLIEELSITVLPFTDEHARGAADARRRFGAGRNALNFGDCMVYAVAKLAGAPLLFKGGEFARTDIEPALPATL